jgi:3-hydroxyisobutyrate dehydrogenase-like beta-hydroxyacid dehydrogenase
MVIELVPSGPAPSRVGFIGLGRMGMPIARNILRAGIPLTVWNRTRAKAEELAGLGCRVAETPRQLAEGCDVVLSMLLEPSATEDVLAGTGAYGHQAVIHGIREGSVVVDMSTNSPLVTRRLSERFGRIGVEFLEAPVIGGPFIAEQSRLTVLVAGSLDAARRVAPLLKASAEKLLYVGPIGAAMSLKLLLNLHLWVQLAAFSECAITASRLGVDPKTLVEVFNSTVFRNYVTEYKASKLVNDEWSPAFTIKGALKDLNLTLELARELGLPLPLTSLTRELFSAAANQGLGELDIMAIAVLYGRLAGERISRLV